MNMHVYTESFRRQAAENRKAREQAEIAAYVEKQARDSMRDHGMPAWARQIIFEKAEKHGVFAMDILGRSRTKKIQQARSDATYSIKAARPATSFPLIAKWMDRDHVTVIYTVALHSKRNGLPAFSAYNIDRKIERTREFARTYKKRKPAGEAR